MQGKFTYNQDRVQYEGETSDNRLVVCSCETFRRIADKCDDWGIFLSPARALEEGWPGFFAYSAMPYTTTYRELRLCCMDEWAHNGSCGYWYSVTAQCMPHIAFRTKEQLLHWLDICGLTLPEPLPEERGTWRTMPVIGEYRKASYLGAPQVRAFEKIVPMLEIGLLDNAQYTLGKVTQDDDGLRTIHYLNCNEHSRVIFTKD